MNRAPTVAWVWSLVRLDIVGVLFAALFFCLSLTPSLLPRDWLTAGIIGAINAAIGYGIGVLIGAIGRRLVLSRRSWWPPRRDVRRVLQAAAIVLAISARQAASKGGKPDPVRRAAEIATGAPKPAAPSRNAPNEKAMRSAWIR